MQKQSPKFVDIEKFGFLTETMSNFPSLTQTTEILNDARMDHIHREFVKTAITRITTVIT
jgi:hypothetical protein